MYTFTWVYPGAHCAQTQGALRNVVKKVAYKCTGTDGLNIVERGGLLDIPDPDPAAFTPFESLTYSTVASWVGARLDVGTLEADMQAELDARAGRPVLTYASFPVMTPFPF